MLPGAPHQRQTDVLQERWGRGGGTGGAGGAGGVGKNVRVWIKKVKTHKRVEAYQNIHRAFTHPHLGWFDFFFFLQG